MLPSQKRGAAATVAIVSTVAGYLATCGGHPFWGLFLQLAAIVSGIFGLVISVSPRVGGGAVSLGAILLGVIGIVVAMLGMLGVIIF